MQQTCPLFFGFGLGTQWLCCCDLASICTNTSAVLGERRIVIETTKNNHWHTTLVIKHRPPSAVFMVMIQQARWQHSKIRSLSPFSAKGPQSCIEQPRRGPHSPSLTNLPPRCIPTTRENTDQYGCRQSIVLSLHKASPREPFPHKQNGPGLPFPAADESSNFVMKCLLKTRVVI